MNLLRLALQSGRLALCALGLLALAGCGFHLKEATPLPFRTLYTNIDVDSDFGARLRRTIQANSPQTRFVDQQADAEVYLHQIGDERTMRQLSIDPEGRVEEYELSLAFSFELLDRDGHVLLAPTVLHSVREIPYNDRIVQAKEGEIERTFRNMQNGLVDQVLRRLSAPEVVAAYEHAQDQPVVPLPEDTGQAPPTRSPLLPDVRQ